MIRTSPKKLLQHEDKLQGQPLPSRVPKNPRVTKYTKYSRGKSNSFAKNVDLGVLSQFPKQHQELLGRERERERERARSSWNLAQHSWRRESGKITSSWGRRAPFITSPEF
jgi:hypothetical protein